MQEGEKIQQKQKQSPSPTKTDKKQKRRKNQAFKTFLNGNNSQVKVAAVGNHSQNEQNLDQYDKTDCIVCKMRIQANKKYCGFCSQLACPNHLRKKRRSKNSGKFVRICDQCEDKYLYQKYMKFQLKAQQSLTAQQLIISTKHQQIRQIVNGKQTKVKLLQNKRQMIQNEHKQFLHKLTIQQNQLNNKIEKQNRKQLQLAALQSQLLKISQKLPRPLQDDYKTLQQQNNKITKQLIKYEKLCNEAIQAKSKKQKDMYEKYYQWQKKETQKKQMKKNDDCIIY